jgi:hypothetical protein
MTKSRKSTGGHAREIVSIQLSVISLGEENPARPGRAEAVQVPAREKIGHACRGSHGNDILKTECRNSFRRIVPAGTFESARH